MAEPLYKSDIVKVENRPAMTTLENDDSIIVHDTSESKIKKITKENLKEDLGINDVYTQTEIDDLLADKQDESIVIDGESTTVEGAIQANFDEIETKATLDTVPTFNGIKFPSTQIASSDVNTLDDYEEGTFTPILTIGDDSTGISSVNSGAYTKTGNTVNFTLAILLSSKGSLTGPVKISGLPFSIKDVLIGTSVGYVCSISYRTGTLDVYELNALLFENSTEINLRGKFSATGSNTELITEEHITDGFSARITGIYFTN